MGKSRILYGQKVEYDVVFSRRRRTLTLEVGEAGLVVRAPAGTPGPEIDDLVTQNAQWIMAKLADAEERIRQQPPREFTQGEQYTLLGEVHSLELVEACAAFPVGEVRITGTAIQVSVFRDLAEADPALHVKEPLVRWFSGQAAGILPALVEKYAVRLGIDPPRVIVRDQQRRWGSCNSRGELRFNFRIVMAPIELVEYIAAHEACHVLELNHSPAFWELVAGVMPDYQKRRALLRHWEPRLQL